MVNKKKRVKKVRQFKDNLTYLPQGIIPYKTKTHEIKVSKINLETPINVITDLNVPIAGINVPKINQVNNNLVVAKNQVKHTKSLKFTPILKVKNIKQVKTTKPKTIKEQLKNYKGNPFRNNTLVLSRIYDKKIPKKKFKVGIVITTHGNNNQKMCKMCLDACLKHIHHPKEVFLFDNESSDPWTCKIPEKYKDKHVTYTRINDQTANGGLTGTWNMGAKMALNNNCHVILFLNNDAFVNETINDLIMLSGFKNNAIVGPLTNQPGYLKNALRNQFIKSNRLYAHFNYKKITDYVNGFCFAVHASALKNNKYDEQYFFNPKLPFSGNEVEWARRHKKKKGNFYICTSCYVQHDKKSSWRNL